MRGRRPIPAELKVLTGNPGRRRIREQAKPTDGLGVAPEWLQGPSLAFWLEWAPVLDAKGLTCRLDGIAFALLCDAVADHQAAQDAIQTEGAVIVKRLLDGREKRMVNPWVAIRQKALNNALAMAREFGLTPSSRSRLSFSAPTADDPDSLEAFARSGR